MNPSLTLIWSQSEILPQKLSEVHHHDAHLTIIIFHDMLKDFGTANYMNFKKYSDHNNILQLYISGTFLIVLALGSEDDSSPPLGRLPDS